MKENLEKAKLLARDLRNDKEFPRNLRETLDDSAAEVQPHTREES